MKGFDYSREIKDSKVYEFGRKFAPIINKKLFKVEYVGLENVPAEGGFIVASNHQHALDPAIIATGIKTRQLHYMGKSELFDNALVGAILKKVNGFPVARGVGDIKALEYATRLVKEGNILGIFPEGTRSKDCKPKRAKRGICVIAKEAEADVLPVSIYTDDNAKLGTKLTVRYGEIIPFEKLGIGGEECSKDDLKQATHYIMDKIVALWEEGHCE